MSVPLWLSSQFPNLAATTHAFTSPATPMYNCIAWAANDTTRWWWPAPESIYYWPEGVPRQETLEAFIAAYATIGFEPCADGASEAGTEKVAIFCSASGTPTHAARQLDDGSWTSKLGKYVDLSHAIDGLDGPVYGRAVKFLRRTKPPAKPEET